MRNLQLLSRRRVSLPGDACAFDAYGKQLAVLCRSGELLTVDDKLSTVSRVHVAVEDDGGPLAPRYDWSFVYAGNGLDELSVITRSGMIVQADEAGAAEELGTFEDGLLAVSWCGNGERVATVSGSGELSIASADEWEIELTVPVGALREGEPATLDWQDDGSHVVLSCWLADEPRRVLIYVEVASGRTWRGRRTAVDEADSIVPDLHGTVAMAGDGSLVAAAQTLRERVRIALFERNGLRHLEFDLPHVSSADSCVTALAWNGAVDLMAVVIQSLPSAEQQTAAQLCLFHRSNYHWALKRRVQLQAGSVLALRWDEEQHYVLRLLLSLADGTTALQELTFAWAHDVSAGAAAIAAVVDGRQVKLTPFQTAIVPPPMSLSQLTLPAAVHCIAFHGDSTMAMLLCDGRLTLAALADSRKHEGTLLGEAVALRIAHVRQLLLLSDTEAVVVAAADGSAVEDVVHYLKLSVVEEADGAARLAIASDKQLRVPSVLRLAHWPDGGVLAFHTDGSLAVIDESEDKEAGLFLADLGAALPEPCIDVAAVAYEEDVMAIGRTARGWLYVNGALLSSSCSSFLLHPRFNMLLWIERGRRTLLKFLHYSAIPNARAAMSRQVERGSRLVALMRDDVRVVLQLPRGNLECLHPHVLVLEEGRLCMDSGRWADALKLFRKHRIDFNLLFDHNPHAWLRSTADFVAQLTAEQLIAFVEAVRNVDTTTLTYRTPRHYSQPAVPELIAALAAREAVDLADAGIDLAAAAAAAAAAPAAAAAAGGGVEEGKGAEEMGEAIVAAAVGEAAEPEPLPLKVNLVCEKLRAALEEASKSSDAARASLLHPLLCTYAKQVPAQLEEALRVVQTVEDDGAALAAMKFLVFVADVSALYNAALGLYDLPLVLRVAELSQRDPQEYMPQLRELSGLEDSLRRFRIDQQLGRPERALRAAAEAGVAYFEEALQVVEKSKLYELALRLWGEEETPTCNTRLLTALGRHHFATGNSAEASACFLACRPPARDEALAAATEAGQWQLALLLCRQLRMSADDTAAQVDSIASVLQRLGRVEEAADVTLRYGEGLTEAISLLLGGSFFVQAAQFAQDAGDEEAAEDVRSAALSRQQSLLESLSDWAEQAGTAVLRITEIRQKRRLVEEKLAEEAAAAGESALGAVDDDADSYYTDTGSLASMATVSTVASVASVCTESSTKSGFSVSEVGGPPTMSAKKRKRKRTRRDKKDKRGGAREEANKVALLNRIMPQSDLLEEVGRTVQALVLFGELAAARLLQSRTALFLRVMRSINLPSVVKRGEPDVTAVPSDSLAWKVLPDGLA